jgi:menaquinone-9 beta-reductase
MNKVHRDIVIIGGGLAGLIAGHQLAKKGREVLLIEKKKYPFHRVCGEYISNEVREFLSREDLYPKEIHTSEISRFQLSSVNGKMAEIPLDLGGFGISRYALDEYLYEKAKDAGVEFILQKQVENVDFIEKDNLFELSLSDGSHLSANFVLGAFGKRSKVDKALTGNLYIPVHHTLG